jgi:hypothetical protein
MMKKRVLMVSLVTVALILALVLVSASPSTSSVSPGKEGKTVFVDISGLGRKDHAANKITELHQKMAKEGFTVIGVTPYTENGDLEGFFVTYTK